MVLKQFQLCSFRNDRLLKFRFEDRCVLTENLFTGLVLFLKRMYLLVSYGVCSVLRVFCLFVCLFRT